VNIVKYYNYEKYYLVLVHFTEKDMGFLVAV